MSDAAPVRVFVSHHHSPQEDAFTSKLVADLQAAGADVWVDTERIPSGDFVRKISEGLAGRQWLVLVMTPEALRSPWVQGEVDAAYHQVKLGRMLGIIPIVAAPCEEKDIPLLWANLQRYDAARDADRAFAGVLRALGISAPPSVHPATTAPPASPSVLPLPPLGPAPVPAGATPAHHLTPMSLYSLGFRGYVLGGVECVLPPLCPIPGGVFTMGSDKTHDKEAHAAEMPQYPVLVGYFAIGQHLATVAEYACAVRAGALREPPPFKDLRKKTDWQTQLTQLDHPVVCVSWQDAIAYTRWLAGVTQQLWRLPTEAEWEKMARWDAHTSQICRYPWGDAFDKSRCNTSESGIGSTTPVGRYPSGASPFQVWDVAGNVWEWTSSLYKPYAYNPNDGREDQQSTGNRVLRGGSWGTHGGNARAACRVHNGPDTFDVYDGFRLAWAPVQIDSE
jgi:formylglycine-generating enzyme required for sulfatase activity